MRSYITQRFVRVHKNLPLADETHRGALCGVRGGGWRDHGGLWRLLGGNVLVKLIFTISWPLSSSLRSVLHSSQVAAERC